MGLECGIILQNPTKTFYPGETIYGRIVIVNDSQRNVKGLKLNFEGKCKVNFSVSERRRRRPGTHHNHGGHHHNHSGHHHNHSGHHHHDNHGHHHSNNHGHHRREHDEFETVEVRYAAEETYLESELNMFGNDGMETMIPPGRYEYPFEYNLPHGLPSSYEGAHGSIQYSIRAALPRSWAFDCKTTTVFRVGGLLDLNNHPEAQQDTLMRDNKSFGCCCFSKGEVSFVLRLQKRGVAIGGFVPFVVEINNGTDSSVKGSMSLCEEVKFYAQGQTRLKKQVICSVDGPSLLRGENDIWRGNVLQIPHIPPSGLGGGCHLIDVRYFLKIILSGSGFFSTLESSTPIIIGTIPFHTPQNMFYENPPPYNSVSSSYNSQPAPSAPGFSVLVDPVGPNNGQYGDPKQTHVAVNYPPNFPPKIQLTEKQTMSDT